MAETNNKQPRTNWTEEGGDDLERVLNLALAKYAAVEPRAGLEKRILARLQCEQTRPAGHLWWRWGLSAAVVVTILVVMNVASKWSKQTPPIAKRPTIVQAPPDATLQVASNGTPLKTPLKAVGLPPKPGAHRPRGASVPSPKLDQFPSPQPLSPEELALARYVQSFPKEATLIAQAQEEFELEIQKEMNIAGSQTRNAGSIQEER